MNDSACMAEVYGFDDLKQKLLYFRRIHAFIFLFSETVLEVSFE